MKRPQTSRPRSITRSQLPPLAVAGGMFLVNWLSNPAPMAHFDYTFWIAEALLHRRFGLTEPPPSWLNEMVQVGDRYYSVFPLGIPQVAQEEFFKHGLFSPFSIPRNAKAMLFEGWKVTEQPPYFIPHGFGGSIFISCPLLLLLLRFRKRIRDWPLITASWIAILI